MIKYKQNFAFLTDHFWASKKMKQHLERLNIFRGGIDKWSMYVQQDPVIQVNVSACTMFMHILYINVYITLWYIYTLHFRGYVSCVIVP